MSFRDVLARINQCLDGAACKPCNWRWGYSAECKGCHTKHGFAMRFHYQGQSYKQSELASKWQQDYREAHDQANPTHRPNAWVTILIRSPFHDAWVRITDIFPVEVRRGHPDAVKRWLTAFDAAAMSTEPYCLTVNNKRNVVGKHCLEEILSLFAPHCPVDLMERVRRGKRPRAKSSRPAPKESSAATTATRPEQRAASEPVRRPLPSPPMMIPVTTATSLPTLALDHTASGQLSPNWEDNKRAQSALPPRLRPSPSISQPFIPLRHPQEFDDFKLTRPMLPLESKAASRSLLEESSFLFAPISSSSRVTPTPPITTTATQTTPRQDCLVDAVHFSQSDIDQMAHTALIATEEAFHDLLTPDLTAVLNQEFFTDES